MKKLWDINVIKNLLKHYGFNFSKSLGQNFIVDPTICPKMAELCDTDKESGVLEIGPGVGILTNELAKRSKKVVTVELDKKLLPILNETLSEFSNIKVINADFLKLDLNKLIEDEFFNMNVVVCANLPYYVTSPIIIKLLQESHKINSVTLMVQREVADRICAGDCNKKTSSISLFVNYYAQPEFLFSVNKKAFLPSPKVDSAVIKLNIRKNSEFNVDDEKLFFKIIKAAFLQRRKTILNSLSNNLNLDKNRLKEILESINISPLSRAENISLLQFAKLSNIYKNILNK